MLYLSSGPLAHIGKYFYISGDCRLPPDGDDARSAGLKTCETETDNEFALVDEATGKKSFYCSDENVRPKR